MSKTNSKVKSAYRLVTDSGERKKTGLFAIEGVRLCTDAVKSKIKIKELYFTQSAHEKYKDETALLFAQSERQYEVTEEIIHKISDTGNPQGIFCICENGMNLSDFRKIDSNKKYIALENIQDPSNLGAVIRTAEALGISGAVMCGCCDIYNPKVLRTSMGSIFRLPVYRTESMAEFIRFAKSIGIKTFTTTTESNAKKINEINFTSGAVCVIGNEGNGVTKSTMELCDERVTIPMLGRAQSLNASMASCITMWEMLR